ncbi:MAG: type I-E CRISPR-associated protein Cas5/CasD [Reinekea sp.]
MDYLLFRLYGPFASWGDIAVGESRHTLAAPAKSAVMGLVAAALGVPREQEAVHQNLNRGYAMASAVYSPGEWLRDYHTVQAPDSVGKFEYRTRRDEIVAGADRLGTVLSSRDYLIDTLACVALKAHDTAPYSLEQIQSALLEPVFTPYLGRKACPLAAPMDPQQISATSFQQAFAEYKPRGEVPLPDQKPKTVTFYWEGEISDFDDPVQLDTPQLMTLIQHDQLRSRKRWQFSPRSLHRYRKAVEEA